MDSGSGSVEPMEAIMNKSIARWFSGKQHQNIIGWALPMLAKAEKEGSWPKKVARPMHAAFGKTATKSLARETDDYRRAAQYNFEDKAICPVAAWNAIYFLFAFASRPEDALRGVEVLEKHHNPTPAQQILLGKARDMANDFIPVKALLKLLDSRRPKRTVIFKTLSPTVVKNLLGDLNFNMETLRHPPVECKWVPFIGRDGKEYQELVCYIKWPEGTVHSGSRYAHGSRAGNAQCHACGHAIKNPSNWVPMLIDDVNGVPHSMWVGTDCARNVFGCEVEGDARYEGRV